MFPGQRSAPRLVPAVAASLALAYLAAVLLPAPALALVSAAAAASTCSLVLLRRPTHTLQALLAGVAAWLAAGLAGAWLLKGSPLGGLAWDLLVVYLLPLPVIPWLYARTFTDDEHNAPERADRLPSHKPRASCRRREAGP